MEHLGLFVTALLVAACGSSPPTGTAAGPPGSASPSTSSPVASASPVVAGPAWVAIQDAIERRGSRLEGHGATGVCARVRWAARRLAAAGRPGHDPLRDARGPLADELLGKS